MPRLNFEGSRIRAVLHYSKHLVVISVVSFLSAQLQNLYVGAMFGPAMLGLYFTWYRLVQLPREILTQVLDRVFFSKASEMARVLAVMEHGSNT